MTPPEHDLSALIQRRAPLLALSVVLAFALGCNKSSNPAPPGAGAVGSVAAAATATEELVVTGSTVSGELAILELSHAVDPSTLDRGVAVYEDTNLDPGGTFTLSSAKAWLYPGGRVLVVLAPRRSAHEVRVQLLDSLRSVEGYRLGTSAVGDAVSLREPGPQPLFELRFRPAPLPSAISGQARNTTDDHGDDALDSTPLRVEAAGEIEVGGDRDWFALLVAAGETLRVSTQTSGDTILSLYSPSGELLAINDDDPEGGRHSQLEYVAAAGGTLYAEVRGYEFTTPAYRLVREGPAPLEPGAIPVDALPTALGESIRTSLGEGDLDYFALSPPRGTETRCDLDDPDLLLVATDLHGRAIAGDVHQVIAGETLGLIAGAKGMDYRDLAALNGIQNPDLVRVGQRLLVPSSGLLSFSAPGGRVYVRVSGPEGSRGAYSIAFSSENSAPTTPGADDYPDTPSGAASLSLGAALTGQIESRGDTDFFQVDLEVSKTYTLLLQSSDDYRLRLLDSTGAVLAMAEGGPGQSSQLAYRPPASGPHFAEVSAPRVQGMRYTLSLEELDEGLPNPDRFRIRAGTDPWRIDFRLREDLFLQDLAARGLRSGDPAVDRLAKDRVIDEVLSFLSEKFLLDSSGRAVPGQSFKISFTAGAPAGRVGRDYSREVVGGAHGDGDRTLGVSYLDIGNRRKEDNDDLGRLGIFSASIEGRRSTLRPGLRSSDLPYLDGTYRLGEGSRSDDRRFEAVRRTISDWGHALAVVTAHEVGHSVGLEHDQSHRRGIMKAALSDSLLSDLDTRFSDASAQTLDDNLDRD